MNYFLGVCVALCAIAVSSINAQQYCPNSWHSFRTQQGASTCIWVSREKTTWFNAQTWCKTMDAHLVEIGSHGFNMRVTQLINSMKKGKYWLGLTDIEAEGQYKWVNSKTSPNFSYFLPGKMYSGGTKNCVHIDEKSQWAAEPCKSEFGFVCQKNLGTSTSG